MSCYVGERSIHGVGSLWSDTWTKKHRRDRCMAIQDPKRKCTGAVSFAITAAPFPASPPLHSNAANVHVPLAIWHHQLFVNASKRHSLKPKNNSPRVRPYLPFTSVCKNSRSARMNPVIFACIACECTNNINTLGIRRRPVFIGKLRAQWP